MSSPGSSPRRGSAERRWASRFSSPVAMELRSIETVTLDSSGPPPVTSSPSTVVNRHGPSTPSGAVRGSRPLYGWGRGPPANDVAKYRRTGRGHQALLERRDRHVPTLIATNTRGHHHRTAEGHQNAGSSPDVTCSNVRPTVGFGARRQTGRWPATEETEAAEERRFGVAPPDCDIGWATLASTPRRIAGDERPAAGNRDPSFGRPPVLCTHRMFTDAREISRPQGRIA